MCLVPPGRRWQQRGSRTKCSEFEWRNCWLDWGKAHWCVNEGEGDLKGQELSRKLALLRWRADDPYSRAGLSCCCTLITWGIVSLGMLSPQRSAAQRPSYCKGEGGQRCVRWDLMPSLPTTPNFDHRVSIRVTTFTCRIEQLAKWAQSFSFWLIQSVSLIMTIWLLE